MKKNPFGKFTYQSPWKAYANCSYVPHKYVNGNNALEIKFEDGSTQVCSVNPPNEILKDNEIAIKNWSENDGMPNWLKLHGVIEREDAIRTIPSGWVEIPVYHLTAKGMKLMAQAK